MKEQPRKWKALAKVLLLPLLIGGGILLNYHLKASAQTSVRVNFSWQVGSGCSDCNGGCDWIFRRSYLNGTDHGAGAGSGTFTVSNNGTSWGECKESDSGASGGDDYRSCSNGAYFDRYNKMYNQSTLGYTNVNQHCENHGGGDDCPINYINVNWVRPSGADGSENVAWTYSGATTIRIDGSANLTWPVPGGATVTYFYALNTTSGGNTYNANGAPGYYVSSTTSDSFTLNNIPSNNWFLHVSPRDNFGDRAVHRQVSINIPAPSLTYMGTAEFPANDGVEWTDPTGAGGNSGISGTQYTFKIVYNSADDAAINPSGTPTIANVEIDTDNNGTPDLTYAMSPTSDKTSTACPAGTPSKTTYLNGQAFCYVGNLTYISTAQKGAWRYRFSFQSQSGALNGFAVGGKTTTTSWQNFNVAPVELKWGYGTNATDWRITDAQTSVNNPVSGAWQTSVTPAPLVLRDFRIKVIYRFTGANSISLPGTISSNSLIVGKTAAGIVGENPVGTPYSTTACSFTPRVEIDVDESGSAGYGSADYCIALAYKTNTADPNEAIFETGTSSSPAAVTIPFTDAVNASSTTHGTSSAANPPTNADSGGNLIHHYRMRVIFDDGAGGQFPDGDVMTDIRTAPSNKIDAGTAGDDDIPGGFITSGTDYRALWVKKNPIIIGYETGAGYDSDTAAHGKGVSPNCAYGGFLTGASRLAGDPNGSIDPGSCASDAPTQLSPPWVFKLVAYDPDGIEPSRIVAGDTGTNGIIAPDVGQYYVITGVDLNDNGNLESTAWDGENEVKAMSCSLGGAGSDYDKWRTAGAICARTINGGTLRYAVLDGNASYDGILRYGFAVRTKYFVQPSAGGADGTDYVFTGTGWNPVQTYTNGSNDPVLNTSPYIQVVNNKPFLTWAGTLGTDPAGTDSCFAQSDFSSGGITPANSSANTTSRGSDTISCKQGGRPFLYRVRLIDYDGYQPGQGNWQVNTASWLGSTADPTRSRLHIDLNNDGDYDDINPYPWSDITFEDATGEKLAMTPLAGTYKSTDLVTDCGVGQPCISAVYEINVPQVYFHYCNSSWATQPQSCTPTGAGGAFAATGSPSPYGDNGASLNAYQFVFTDESGLSATSVGGVVESAQAMEVLNNPPKLLACGLGFTSLNGGQGWESTINYDYPTDDSYYPNATDYNTERGAYNDDFVHPLDLNRTVDTGTNPDDPGDPAYWADNAVVTQAQSDGVDQSFVADTFRFCVRYIDEDRFEPFPDTTRVAIDRQGSDSSDSWNSGTNPVPMVKLQQLRGQSDTDAGKDNSTGAGATGGFEQGIVYIAQSVIGFPTESEGTGFARYDLNGNNTKYDVDSSIPVDYFTDTAFARASMSPNEEPGVRVVNKFPYVSVMYKWDVPHGSSAMKFVCLQASGGSCTSAMSTAPAQGDIWPLTSLYRESVTAQEPVKVSTTSDWPYNQDRAINYWAQYFKDNALNPTASTSAWSSQKYFGGSQSGCISGSTANSIYHVKASGTTPHVSTGSNCLGQGANANSHPNGGNLVDIFSPMQYDSNDEVWESFASFTYAFPAKSGSGNLLNTSFTDSRKAFLYGYTGTVFRFALMYWKPRSFTAPVKLGLGIDFDRDGKYTRTGSDLTQSEITYYRYEGSTIEPNDPSGGNVLYGAEPENSSYYCQWSQMPYQTTARSALMPCKPYVLYQNVRVGAPDVSYPEGSVVPYHFAFLVQDQDPTAPITRHPATYDPDSEIYMGNDANMNSPVMQNCGLKQSPPCNVTPFDPWVLVKYRKGPTLEPYPVVKNGDNKYQFRVKYTNPYRLPPSCSDIDAFYCKASEKAAGNVGHAHILIDMNGNGVYEANEKFKMSVKDVAQATSDFNGTGSVDFYFPNPNTQPDGYKIPFGKNVKLSYVFDFAEYTYTGTGSDRGLKADQITGTFNLDEMTEEMVVRNNYQHPGSNSTEPVKILVGNRTSDGKIIVGKYSVRIYSVSGRMIYDGNGKWVDKKLENAQNETPLIWDLKSNAGKKVGSGVYLVILVREINDVYQKPVKKKIVVVRGKESFAWE